MNVLHSELPRAAALNTELTISRDRTKTHPELIGIGVELPCVPDAYSSITLLKGLFPKQGPPWSQGYECFAQRAAPGC